MMGEAGANEYVCRQTLITCDAQSKLPLHCHGYTMINVGNELRFHQHIAND